MSRSLGRADRDRVTRRSVLLGAAAFGAGITADRVLGSVSGDGSEVSDQDSVPFYGRHQSGIATPAQQYVNFAAYDLTSDASDDLRQILQAWTTAAAALTAGNSCHEDLGLDQGPTDPGEAVGIGPARLTVTIGFGPGVFVANGANRFGLVKRRPAALAPLRGFRGEQLDSARSDGDLCVQACADDPQVAFHAIHVFTRLAAFAATLRWQQLGFGRTSSTSRAQKTPRNLMGFKDGTANIRAEESEAMETFVWVQPDDGYDWMTDGSYLVARRIQILFDVWDATSLEGQEQVIGRRKDSGAPLGQGDEYDPIDLDARRHGSPVIPESAHVRLASSQENAGQRILRRGYSFAEPPEPGSGQIEAGLFFIAFQRDPRRQFVPIQRRLASSDALNHHILHTASALFACPPGVKKGGFIGEGLFT